MNNPYPFGDYRRLPVVNNPGSKQLSHRKLGRSRGLTLIELMMALCIIMIITTVGASTLPGFLHKQVENAAFDSLFHLVTFARTKAIHEQEIFTLCASADGISCSGPWNQQIIVFNDNNKNAQVDAGEIVHRQFTLPQGTPCLEWNVGLNRQYLRFKPDGTTAGTAGHFKFCDSAQAQLQKKLVISFTGRTQVRNL